MSDTLFDGLPVDGPAIEPVTIVHVPDHSYVKGPKGARGCKAPGCNKARAHPVHNLPTQNETLTHDWAVYQGAKKHWQPFLIGLIEETGLPKGLDSILVEGLCVFPTKQVRDKDNHKAFIQKVLGDALSTPYCSACRSPWDDHGDTCSNTRCLSRGRGRGEGERREPWIEDDSWFPISRYDFDSLRARYERGERRTELLLMPNALLASE